ncbi:unnamed protein product [Phaeothamnion confervicola]
MVNSLLSEATWGSPDDVAIAANAGVAEPAHFSFVDGPPSPFPPDSGCSGGGDGGGDGGADGGSWVGSTNGGTGGAGAGRLCTFNEFLEKRVHPSRPAKKHIKGTFTDPGGVGRRFRPDFDRLLALLRPPPDVAAALTALGVSPDGRYHLLPSFLCLVAELERERKGGGRPWSVVFRTFGTDTAAVAKEWNLFCESTHPVAAAAGLVLDGSRGGPDRRLHLPRSSGRLWRGGRASGRGVYGNTGGSSGGDGPTSGGRAAAGAGDTNLDGLCLAVVDDETQLVSTREGLQQVAAEFSRRAAAGETFAVRDDFAFWDMHGESCDSGKLLLLPPGARNGGGSGSGGGGGGGGGGSGGGEAAEQFILFFDDNVERDHAHIVDVRNAETGERVPFERALGRCIVKVEPLLAIADANYFVSLLRSCEAQWGRSGGKV